MAIIKGFIQMTGSVKGMSFYTRMGSDQVIMRTKGGASKQKIESSPKFEGLRKQQKEWNACVKFSAAVRNAMGGLARLADYNLAPVLNGMGKNIQKLDTEKEIGQRDLKLSTLKRALEGYSFNRKYPFNSVLRVAIPADLDRELLSATVTIPRINTEVDLLNVQKLPFFRLIVSIGTVSDLCFNEQENEYAPLLSNLQGVSIISTGKWNSANTVLEEHSMMVQMDETLVSQLTSDVSVILCMGIEFGTVGFLGEPVEVKYAGCAKVLLIK